MKHLSYDFNRRGGRLLDVSKSGYYNTELCLEDFENVSCVFSLSAIFIRLHEDSTKRLNAHYKKTQYKCLGC